MADSITCPGCGEEVESAAALEEHEAPEIEVNDDGTLNVYENRDLYLCKSCKQTLGTSRS